ncbi:putative Fe-S cluster assembly protein SufT [bacterium]|nr:putative Fe-S cluster assembly protein SufT [bacterium]
MAYDQIETRRECDAVAIPQGTPVRIPAGTMAVITQSLGGSYTLQIPSMGGLFRVAGRDADALGLTPEAVGEAQGDSGGPVSEEHVWAQLKNVYDPEIPVNIVDLGLVYDLRILPAPSGGSRVEVKMTLTAQGCGMGGPISMDAKHRIESLPGVDTADVEVVWDPPWNPHMISPEGRAKLGME